MATLAEAQAQLAAWEAASLATSSGKSYTIDTGGINRQLTRNNADEIVAMINHWTLLRIGDNSFTIYPKCIYRAKPEKPRTGVVNWTEPVGRCMAYQAIELTPEVCQALKDAGIEY